MNPLVSVIIPNYNGAPFIAEALETVFEQRLNNLEVIVIDDGSTDNSMEILERFRSQIKLISTENFGAAAARNSGMKAARGEFIAFLDSDDLWTKDKLTRQLYMLQKLNLDLVYCSSQEFGNEIFSNLIHKAKYEGDCYQYFKRFPTEAIIAQTSGAVIRASLLRYSGLFDETFSGASEDWDFFRRYCRYAKVGFCEEILVYYRRHGDSITARSVYEYNSGNRKAVLKMFTEDASIRFIERRLIWAKFNYMSGRGFLKLWKFRAGIYCLLSIVLPVK